MRHWINLIENFAIPSVWYHSTELDPEVVAHDFENNNVDPTGAVKDEQYWFADSWEASRYYGENTVVARLLFRNPLVITEADEPNEILRRNTQKWARLAKQQGHDAVVIEGVMDGDMFSTVCAVFDPSLIQARPYARYNEETDSFDLL